MNLKFNNLIILNLILSKFASSGEIINGHWMILLTINAMTGMEKQLFC